MDGDGRGKGRRGINREEWRMQEGEQRKSRHGAGFTPSEVGLGTSV